MKKKKFIIFLSKYLKLIIIFLGIINVFVIYIFEIPCPIKTYFNIFCPGCGATRMIKSLLKLDIYQAFRFNPLLFCLLIIGIIYFIYYLICKYKNKNYYKIKYRDVIIVLFVIILFTVLRNLPGFDYLKPMVIR